MKRTLLAAAAAVSIMAGPAAAERWANESKRCEGTTERATAQLMDIPWGQNWIAACSARRDGPYGIRRGPDKCEENLGAWGIWYTANAPACRPEAKAHWEDVAERCSAPGTVTVSAKLMDIAGSWEAACNAMTADGKVAALGVSGKPKCVATATGMYGEWVKTDEAKCGSRFKWTEVGERCSAPGVVTVSAKLTDVQGGWEDACAASVASGDVLKFGVSGKPDCKKTITGMYGEWSRRDEAKCGNKVGWTGAKTECTRAWTSGVSARLMGIPYGVSWEKSCEKAEASGEAAKLGASGKPTRCINEGAFGIWGQWDTKSDDAACKSIGYARYPFKLYNRSNEDVFATAMWIIPDGDMHTKEGLTLRRNASQPINIAGKYKCHPDAMGADVNRDILEDFVKGEKDDSCDGQHFQILFWNRQADFDHYAVEKIAIKSLVEILFDELTTRAGGKYTGGVIPAPGGEQAAELAYAVVRSIRDPEGKLRTYGVHGWAANVPQQKASVVYWGRAYQPDVLLDGGEIDPATIDPPRERSPMYYYRTLQNGPTGLVQYKDYCGDKCAVTQ